MAAWPLWRFLAAVRHPLLLVFVLAQTVLYRTATDWDLLTEGARALTGPRPFELYAAHPHLQAGPTALVVVRLFDVLPSQGLMAAHLLLAVLGWYLLYRVERWQHPMGVPIGAAVTTLLVGLPTLGVWSFLAGGYPHLEDGLVVLAFFEAVRAVQRHRWLAAALLVGLAMSLKPWAVAAWPLLWGTSRRGRSLVVAALVPALCWAPFLLLSRRTLRAVGSGFFVQGNSTLRVLGFSEHDPVPSWWRLLQLFVTLTAAGVVTWRRGWSDALAAGGAMRLLLDPAGLDYYVSGLVLITVLSDRMGLRTPWRGPVLAVALLYAKLVLPDESLAWWRAFVLLLVFCSWLRPARKRSDTADGRRPAGPPGAFTMDGVKPMSAQRAVPAPDETAVATP